MTTNNPTLASVDQLLAQRAADADRIADALGALEIHPGNLFLSGASLTGQTATSWATATESIALLYARFTMFRDTLAKAQEVRARRNRPGPTELAELAELLEQPSIEVAREAIPLAQRNLTGPAMVTTRTSLPELLRSMDTAFGEVTGVVVAADEVWTAFTRALDPLDAQLDTARETAGSLGLGESRDPLFVELGRIGDESARLRALAFADPLSLYTGLPGSGQPNLHAVDAATGDLGRLRGQLDQLVAVRAEFDQRLARAEADIAAVGALEDRARQDYDTVLAKIASPAIDRVVDSVPALRTRLAQLAANANRQQWRDLSAELAGLVSAIGDASARATAVRDTAAALLGRRTELRGRLDAYRAKAAGLRFIEDAVIAECYQRAHDLLWTSPCDLRAATRALVRYQQAISDKGSVR